MRRGRWCRRLLMLFAECLSVSALTRRDQHPRRSPGDVLRRRCHEEVQAGHHGSSQVRLRDLPAGFLPVTFLLGHGLREFQGGRRHSLVHWVGNIMDT